MPDQFLGEEGLRVVTFGEEHVLDVFELIEGGREHLNAFGQGIADKYPDLTSVFRSAAYVPVGKERFVIISGQQEVVGRINTTKTNDPSELIVGYWIGLSKIRQGYATLATDALARGLFNSRARAHINTLSARVNPGNIASKSVLTRANFVYAGEVAAEKGVELLYERYRP